MASKVRTAQIIDEALALSLLPARSAGSHKWSVGGLVVIGGAPGYIGAPALCARAAARSGAGIVSVAVSRLSVGPIAGLAPEATFLPLPDGDPNAAAQRALDVIKTRVEQSRAIVAGPGLSQDDHAAALLAALFGTSGRRPGTNFGFGSGSSNGETSNDSRVLGGSTPAVIDADALNWLAGQESWWTSVEPMSLILTPHSGEMAKLIEAEVDAVRSNPVVSARDAAKKWKQVVLLKGEQAILTDGDTTLTSEATPQSLATAGTGDVLAGSIGAFLAQGLSLIDAGALAIFVGLEAARAVEEEFGTLGLIAGDLPDAIGRALGQLEHRQRR